MKDTRALFVDIPGDDRLSSVNFDIAFRCSPSLMRNAEQQYDAHLLYQRYAFSLARQSRSRVEDCFQSYTTEKIFWRLGQAFISLRARDLAKIGFTLSVSDSFMGKDCSTIELFTTLIKLNDTMFNLIKDVNETRAIEQSGIHFDYGIIIQGFRQADGKHYSTPSVLVNTGIDQCALL